MRLVAITLGAMILAGGCANPVNLRTAERYADACGTFLLQKEWWKARLNCGRAALNADLGHASPQVRAELWYEYGRASGAICDYAEAKRGLDTALKLDEDTGGPTFMSLLELARLELDQGHFKESAAYFARFEAAIPAATVEKEDPIGYADSLDEYARAVEGAGNGSAAFDLRQRSRKLRNANPGKSSNTDRTPYGKYCDQKS